MTGIEIGILSIVFLLIAIYIGLHISISLILVSYVCVILLRGPDIAGRFVSAAANDVLNEHLFGVVPLFILMGLLVSVSGIGRDLFDAIQWIFRRFLGGLGIATVAANAVFAAVTGISIASATVFTRVAVPEMVRHGYSKQFSVGIVAGSSVLGVMIPPSLLLIVYAVIAEESIGRLFLAGLLPGLLMAASFCVLIIGVAIFRPHHVGGDVKPDQSQNDLTLVGFVVKLAPTVLLIVLVLGGIYSGFFTPTEAGAVGAAGALVIAVAKRTLSLKDFINTLKDAGQISVSVLFLILAANLYSRMLAMSGMPTSFAESIVGLELGPVWFLIAYLGLVILMGMILDSISILLILLPVVLPIAAGFEMDLIWFGIITVVAVEIGLVTPPFGLSIFAVKAALLDHDISLRDIFVGAMPFVLCMMAVLFLLVMFPAISTVLVY